MPEPNASITDLDVRPLSAALDIGVFCPVQQASA
jgi:hypothetical protein